MRQHKFLARQGGEFFPYEYYLLFLDKGNCMQFEGRKKSDSSVNEFCNDMSSGPQPDTGLFLFLRLTVPYNGIIQNEKQGRIIHRSGSKNTKEINKNSYILI